MKTALKARLKDQNWMDEVPWVLLGIKTALKEDLRASSAELVYGYPSTVPGDFVIYEDDPPPPAQALPKLRETVSKLLLTPTSRHGTTKDSVPLSLAASPYVFVRKGGTQAPLQKPYEGPFQVIEYGGKTFKLEKGNRTEIMSVDRLKPTHLDLEDPVIVAEPRRRGRPPQKKEEDPVKLRRSNIIKTQAAKVWESCSDPAFSR